MRISSARLCLALALIALPTSADADAPALAPGDDGLPGLFRTDDAGAFSEGLALGLYGSFGLSGELLEENDEHRRSGSRFLLSYAPSESLAVALRLDGRYDQHFKDGGEEDDGWVGDPRLLLRYRLALADKLDLGAQLGLWFPGQDAPSVIFDAISPELTFALSYRAVDDRLNISANAGYRLDRSAASIENPERLSPEDRLALGLSDNNAVLLATGASFDLGPVEALAEWSWDLLHGEGAPSASASPMRVSVGLRRAFGPQLVAQAIADIRVNSVELPMDPTALVPVEPGFQAFAGVQYLFDFGGDEPSTLLGDEDSKGDDKGDQDEPAEPAKNPLTIRVAGTDGAKVELFGQDGVTREATRNDDGSYTFDDVPNGSYELRVSAPGFDRAAKALSVNGKLDDIEVELVPSLPPGQLRGAIRSFRGQGLGAQIRIYASADEAATATPTELSSAIDGAFSIDLPPGAYRVEIQAQGYKAQTREVKIEQDGVTILNVDLRK